MKTRPVFAHAILCCLVLLISACTTGSSPETATLAYPSTATYTPTPSATSIPISPTATLQPVEGIALTQLNVRSGPGTYYTNLGMINKDAQVQITAIDLNGEWFQIIYPEGPEQRGWVAANYVRAGETDNLPIASVPGINSGTSMPTGRITIKLNVRSGPGTNYNVLGIIQPPASVILTGKNDKATWLQIIYEGGPDGRGWVTAAYVQVGDTHGLPVLNASGTPASAVTESPTSIPIIPTATLAPALADGDTQSSPGTQITFSPLSIQQFIYTSDLSSPQGDLEDWVAFIPYSSQATSPAHLTIHLTCQGNGTINTQLWQENALVENWESLACGETRMLALTAGKIHVFHMQVVEGEGLQYVLYTLSVHNAP